MATVGLPSVPDVDEQHWVDGYRARLGEIGCAAAAAAERLAGVAATASSRDGAATVTVDAAGALDRVVFGPTAAALPRTRLADAVLEAARQARAQAARDALAAAEPLLGPRSGALRLLRAQLPGPDRPGSR